MYDFENKDKFVIIMNGSGNVGKDTFVSMLGEHFSIYKTSIIDFTKEFYKNFGIEINSKLEEHRIVLYKTKQFFDKTLDASHRSVNFEFQYFIHGKIDRTFILEDYKKEYDFFSDKKFDIFVVDMREKNDIERFCDYIKENANFLKVLVVNDNVPHITSNDADKNIFEITYDYVVKNNGTIEDLEKQADELAGKIKLKMKLTHTNNIHAKPYTYNIHTEPYNTRAKPLNIYADSTDNLEVHFDKEKQEDIHKQQIQ